MLIIKISSSNKRIKNRYFLFKINKLMKIKEAKESKINTCIFNIYFCLVFLNISDKIKQTKRLK